MPLRGESGYNKGVERNQRKGKFSLSFVELRDIFRDKKMGLIFTFHHSLFSKSVFNVFFYESANL
jgi:hypothetical protein